MRVSQTVRRVSLLVLALAGSMLTVACQEPSGGKGAATHKSESSTAAGSASIAKASRPWLSAYSPGATATPLQYCNLEAAGGTKFAGQPVVLKADRSNEFSGWVDDGGLASPQIWLRFDEAQGKSRLHVPLRLAIQRQDVTAAHPDASRTPGFRLDLPAKALPSGRYHVYVSAVSNGVAHVCDNGRQIDVEP